MSSSLWLKVGMRLAQQCFAKRGGHSEAHLRQEELAALLTVAAEQGAADFLEELRAAVSALEYAAEDFETLGKPKAAIACRTRADHALALMRKATGEGR